MEVTDLNCVLVIEHIIDVYKDYKKTNLKYYLFIVPLHNLYDEMDFNDEEDFIIHVPERMCEAHGKEGVGCIWEPKKYVIMVIVKLIL